MSGVIHEEAMRSAGASVRTLERQNFELGIISKVATALNQAVDLDSALSTVLSHVAALLDLCTGWVLLVDQEGGEPRLAAAQNLPPGLVSQPDLLDGSCHCLQTFQSGDLTDAANVNVVVCSRLGELSDGAEGLRYHASIPLQARGRKLGVLNVASAEWRRLSGDDLRMLHAIGDMLGTAIERAQLLDERMAAGAEKERNRLAREIHDTIAQGLSATALQLETAEALLDADADLVPVRAAVHRALETTRENLREARRSVLDLRASPLPEGSLKEAISRICERAGDDPAITARIGFLPTGVERAIPSRVEAAVYRVANEAFTNALRHARARNVLVQLDISPEDVTLAVTDDGIGFSVCERREGRFGLVGMRERVKLLGGQFRVFSQPGKGTRVVARVAIS